MNSHRSATPQRGHAGRPLEPLEAQLADVVALHPEYHALLESDDGGARQEWTPEGGESNPFLHMGLHLALREQLATDRPGGIRAVHSALAQRLGDLHEAEHRMLDCLAETLWQAQRSGTPPDEAAYLERLRRL
ncbi:MAG TPA: DUF1841 family protein [Gammaproteobacteria bacterium]